MREKALKGPGGAKEARMNLSIDSPALQFRNCSRAQIPKDQAKGDIRKGPSRADDGDLRDIRRPHQISTLPRERFLSSSLHTRDNYNMSSRIDKVIARQREK